MEEYLEKIAREELNETPERLKQDLAIFKEWITTQPHIISRNDDAFLISFLRNAKYRLEAAKKKFDAYHLYRTNYPEFFINRVPLAEEEMNLMKAGGFTYLSDLHPRDNGRIFIFDMGAIDEHECDLRKLCRLMNMVHDRFTIYDKYSTIVGVHYVVDYRNVTMITATQITALAQKLIHGVENAYPVRIKQINIVNLDKAHPILRSVIKMVISLFKSKLGERFKFHENFDSLHEDIPKEILPTEYGGLAGSLQSIQEKNWMKLYLSDEKWFLDDLQYKTDESKRIGGSKANEMFGTEGSFRKMDVD